MRGAFYFCNLSSVQFPGSVVFIGRNAFDGNNNLASFKLPTSANKYNWYDSNGDKHNEGDIIKDKYYSYVAIIPYTLKDEDVDVLNGIITGCSYFNNITNFASVITIPGTLDGQKITGIADGVFSNRGISEVILPDGLKTIGNWTFAENEIINITIPATVETISEYAFNNNCINSIVFEPSSQLNIIEMNAFSGNRLVKIKFPQNLTSIEKFAFGSNYLQNVEFEANSKLLSIGSGAFQYNNLLNFKLPDPTSSGHTHWVDWDSKEYSSNLTVTNFESFYKIPIEYTLTDDDVEIVNGIITRYTPREPFANIITIPEILDGQEVIGIGMGVFLNSGLIGVYLPSTLQIIEQSAFSENEILSLSIPRNVLKIDGNAFFRNNIKNLFFEDNSRLRYIGWSAFYNNKITSLVLPDTLNIVEGYAFSYNRIANAINVPDSLQHIGRSAFEGNLIPRLSFNENSILSYLGAYAFSNNNISNEIFIPLALTEISDYAFVNNNISKIITHVGIVEYGNGAFAYNNSALKIVLHKPPTIPFVTHFFGWKDNDGVYHNPGESIPDFSNRYKAVIDQYFVVKFVVEDDNGVPIENASVNFYGNTLTTDINGIDSIGPVMRGLQHFEVTADGCFKHINDVDVQDDMTVSVILIRYYNISIRFVDLDGNPVSGVTIVSNDIPAAPGKDGLFTAQLPDGQYPYTANAVGYKEYSDSVKVLDSDTAIIVILYRVLITHYPNGGSGNAFTDISFGNTFTTHNNPFTRDAYTFSHWNTHLDNTGIQYKENESFELSYTDIDLYAIWKPIDYNIIYHLNGGTNAPDNPDKYNIESEINFLPASKTSLYFATWIDADSNRVNRIEKGNTGDILLWAVFTPEPTYFIDYHNLENATHRNQSSYTKFDLPFAFTNANKKGYEFTGWYEDSLLSIPIASIPDGSTTNYNVYAKWGGAINYIINYELNGGINSNSNPISYTIESESITFESPSKAGANFIGWFADEEYDIQVNGIPQGSIGDTVIYASWELDNYDITYVLNGGINDSINPDIYTVDSDKIIFYPATKPGATFVGWFSDNDFTTQIKEIPKGSFGDTIIYANWESDVFEISYELNGGLNDSKNPVNYTIESKDISFESPSKDGANFMGWFADEEYNVQINGIPQGSIGDTVIYARWNLNNYDINYVLNGGINDSINPDNYTVEERIIFYPATKPGATFIGWYSDVDFTSEIKELPTGSFGDTTIYANWESDIFEITYELNGGINNSNNPANYTIESEDIEFESPTKVGASFMAWYSDKNFNSEIIYIPQGTIGDTIIYAKWELDTFKIQYELDGGTNNFSNPFQYTVESNEIILMNPDKEGYIFQGWFENAGFDKKISSIPAGSTGDKIMYAKWLELFQVQFVITTDGTNPANLVDIVISDSIKLTSDILGLADTIVVDGSTINFSIEINGIEIDNGSVTVSGNDVMVKVEIVDCYMRWYDVIFCDNGKGLWLDFVWFKDNIQISEEQFFHNPGGIEDGEYTLKVTSTANIEYIWKGIYENYNLLGNEYKANEHKKENIESDNFEVNIFPNPVQYNGVVNVKLSENTELQNNRIYIYDLVGSLILTIEKPFYLNKINIDDKFSSGLYHLVLFNEFNETKTVREFIVK